MSPLASILVYGRDLSLLESRGWVLEKAGYHFLIALDLEKVKQIAASESIDLLLICHSLSPEDSVEALETLAPIRPGMRHLLMTANTVVAPALAAKPSVSAFDGPLAMIAAVSRVMGTEDGAAHKAKSAS